MRLVLLSMLLLIVIGPLPRAATADNFLLTSTVDNNAHKDYDDLCGRSSVNEDALTYMDIYTRAEIDRIARGVIKFDLGSVPSGQQIARARLRLWAILQGEYNSNTHNTARITEDWTSTEMTWCDRMNGVTWSTPGVSYTTAGQASVWVPSKFGEDLPPDGNHFPYEEWIEWDVTEIVRAWVEQGQPNHGLVVYQTDLFSHGRNQAIQYASREYEDNALVPQLVIETCPDGEDLPTCRIMNESERLFGTRFSRDASGFGPPGNPVFYDSTEATITKAPGDRFYVSGHADNLTEWICDDRLYIEDVYVDPVGFQGILDPAFPLCEAMGDIVGGVAAREVTEFIPDGTNCITFKIADTQREIYGNTEIYLVKEPFPISVETTSWGRIKSRYR